MGFDEGGADEFAREVEGADGGVGGEEARGRGAEDGGEGGGEGEGVVRVVVDVEGVEGAVCRGVSWWVFGWGRGDLLVRPFLLINSVARALRRAMDCASMPLRLILSVQWERDLCWSWLMTASRAWTSMTMSWPGWADTPVRARLAARIPKNCMLMLDR